MSSSTIISGQSSANECKSQSSTAQTSPESDNVKDTQQSDDGINSNNSTSAEQRFKFEKRSLTAPKFKNNKSTFSSFSTSDADTVQTATVQHYHNEQGTWCECDSPPAQHKTGSESSRIQTPASALPSTSTADFVKIGTQFPFTSNQHQSSSSTGVSSSSSTVGSFGDPRNAFMARSKSTNNLFNEQPRSSNYMPALHVIKSKDNDPSRLPHQQQQQSSSRGLVFTSEEQARETVMARNNYSLPPSPTGLINTFPRQFREVSPALRRNNSTDTVSDQGYYYSGEFARPAGPPSRSHWKPDSARSACVDCKNPFTLIGRRRHHCRRCGDIFCGFDSRFIINLDQNLAFNPIKGTPSRACTSCATEYDEFKLSLSLTLASSYSHHKSYEDSVNPLANQGMPIRQSSSSSSSSTTPRAGHELGTTPHHLSSSHVGLNSSNTVVGSVQSRADWSWSTF